MARPSERPRRVRSGILFIFDLDGTLYRTETSFLPAVPEVFKQHGLASPDRDDVMSLVGAPLGRQNEWLEARGLPQEALPLLEEAEFRLLRNAGELYPRAAETLAGLRELGHTLVICTNGREVYARAVLEPRGLLGLFAEVRAGRPEDADKAGTVVDLLSRNPHQRAIVVGDRYHDIAASRAKRMRCRRGDLRLRPTQRARGCRLRPLVVSRAPRPLRSFGVWRPGALKRTGRASSSSRGAAPRYGATTMV